MIRVLRELTAVQRKIADLQVELQGRKVMFIEYIFHVLYIIVSLEIGNFQLNLVRNPPSIPSAIIECENTLFDLCV